MSTIPLTCDGFANALADYLERDDTPRMHAALETHAARCAACGSLLADLQQLRVDAAGLPTLSPERDLWSAIAERIEAPVVDIGTRGSGARDAREGGAGRAKLVPLQSRTQLAAAAAALVFLTAGVTYVATRQAVLAESPRESARVDTITTPAKVLVERAYDSARQAEIASAPVGAASVPSRAPSPAPRVPASLVADQSPASTVETVYGREIARLWRIVEERRMQLDTATVGVLERNLDIIDKAIRESRAALARDPASAFLNEQLNNVLEQKVELLRAVALLPARS